MNFGLGIYDIFSRIVSGGFYLFERLTRSHKDIHKLRCVDEEAPRRIKQTTPRKGVVL